MRNLMKTELYKLKKDMTVWIISLVLVCCAGMRQNGKNWMRLNKGLRNCQTSSKGCMRTA